MKLNKAKKLKASNQSHDVNQVQEQQDNGHDYDRVDLFPQNPDEYPHPPQNLYDHPPQTSYDHTPLQNSCDHGTPQNSNHQYPHQIPNHQPYLVSNQGGYNTNPMGTEVRHLHLNLNFESPISLIF